MITAEQTVAVSILSCVAGALLTLVVSRSKTVAGWIAFLVTAGTAVLIFLATARVLTAGPSLHPAAFWAMPKFGFVLRIHVDGLTAFFLLLTGLVAVPASLYSIAYMRRYEDYGVARYSPYFLLFLAAMYGLLSTTDMARSFFIFWQMMALSAYALIRFEHRKRENVRAAYKYLVAMELACAAVMVGTGLLAMPGQAAGIEAALRYDLDTLSANLPLLLSAAPGTTALAFTLLLTGFGILMGMWPFGQFWLPDAEPAAPAPVSALISGVMIKIGVYGLLRYFLWIVPMRAHADYPLASFGVLVAVLGTITLFTGTMQALKQEQSKRLLAFHSIGQIGYILLGAGTCMVLLPAATPAAVALATLAFFGALFHVLNHGLFKGLLFLNAGSMLHATDTQDLNQMGGMMKYMPLTALTALVASCSISGVPLFNGFVSKWIIYVAAIQGSGSARYLAVCAVIAILTSALTLASFIKFFGASFLSRTSALVKAQAANGRLEVPWTMQLPQLVLAFFCVLLGVVPAIGFRLLQRALEASRGGLPAVLAGASPMVNGPLTGLAETSGAALFSPLVLAAVLGLMFLAAYGISKLGSAPRRAADPWLCGYAREADCYRYSAHNFYGEIKRYFGWLGGAPHAHGDKPPAVKELS
ncbi:MAG: proton-conducting transporter membrane subunit [Terriglobales bacterium]